MNTDHLQRAFIEFANNPAKSWGEPVINLRVARGLSPIMMRFEMYGWQLWAYGFDRSQGVPSLFSWHVPGKTEKDGHQRLTVDWQEGTITKMCLSTIARHTGACFNIEWHIGTSLTRYSVNDKPRPLNDPMGANSTVVDTFRGVELDFIVAMTPHWMLPGGASASKTKDSRGLPGG